MFCLLNIILIPLCSECLIHAIKISLRLFLHRALRFEKSQLSLSADVNRCIMVFHRWRLNCMGAGIFRFFPSSPSSFSSSLFSFVEASATIKSWFHFARHAPPEIIRFFSTSCNSTETLYFRDVDGNARIFFLVACKRVHLSLSLSLSFLFVASGNVDCLDATRLFVLFADR